MRPHLAAVGAVQGAAVQVASFHQLAPSAVPPMRADKTALGRLPSVAYQFCEAVRSASAFGWYIFPPKQVRLFFDGADIFYAEADEWIQLTSVHLSEEFLDHWDEHAPPDMHDRAPPFMTALSVPGIVQIWSGHLVSTTKDWSILLRAPANIVQSPRFSCFEGIIETDHFQPSPLFINLQIHQANQEILIPQTKPLFQVQPIRRECYGESTLGSYELKAMDEGGMSDEDWKGYLTTTRSSELSDTSHRAGSYGARVRKRGKRETDGT